MVTRSGNLCGAAVSLHTAASQKRGVLVAANPDVNATTQFYDTLLPVGVKLSPKGQQCKEKNRGTQRGSASSTIGHPNSE